MATRDELITALRNAHDAGDEEGARRIAAMIPATETQKRFTAGEIATGVGDVLLSSARGLVNRPAASLAGVVGAINPNDTYMAARDRAAAMAAADTELVKGEQLRTEPGRAIAGGIDAAMRKTHIPQTIEAVGEGIKKYFGPETADFLGSLGMLATLKGPRALSEHPAAVAVRKAETAGFTVPPITPTGGASMAGSTADRALVGITGKTAADDVVSLRNQAVTGRYVAQAGGLTDAGGTIERVPTPQGLRRAVAAANADYEAIKAVRAPIMLQADPATIMDLVNIGNRIIGSNERTDFAITKMRNNLLTSRMDVAGIVDRIQELRTDSFKHRRLEDPKANRLGLAERQAADALEGGLDRFFQRQAARKGANSPAALLYQNWVKARQKRATLHTVEDAMNPSTGEIDAKAIAKDATEKRLDPRLQIIADSYNSLGGRAFKTPIRSLGAGTPATPQLVFAGGAAGAAGGAALGGPLGAGIGAIIGALAPSVTRDILRSYALRGPTTRFVQKAAGQGGQAAALGAAVNEALQEDEK